MPNLHTVLAKLDGKLGDTEGHSIAIHKGLDLKYSTGSGLARVDSLDHENLLRLILLSFVAYSRTQLICHELRIVIRPEDVSRIDLIRVREFLRNF